LSARNDPGRLRFRLELQEETETPDGAGGFATAWMARRFVWAEVQPLAATRIERAGNVLAELTHEIRIRRHDGVRPGMRFAIAARRFRIETVRDPDETGRFLLCLAKEET
jgi:SPP1 family predicted phage head-tail adaptor